MIAGGFAVVAALALPEPAVELDWDTSAPSACNAQAFQGQLDRLLQGSATDRNTPLEVRVRLDAQEDGAWRLAVWTNDEEDSLREFESATCESVVEAAALVVAMELDPQLFGAEEPPEEVATEPAPEPPPPAEQAAHEPPPPARQRAGLEGHIGVSGGAFALGLPEVAGAFGARLSLGRGRWRVEAGGRYRLPTEYRASDGGGSFQYATARVGACAVVVDRPRVAVSVCPAVELGQVYARGIGLDRAVSSRRPWLAARFAPAVEFPVLDGWSVGLRADLGVPLMRERYTVDGNSTAYKVGAVELGGVVDLRFRVFGGRK